MKDVTTKVILFLFAAIIIVWSFLLVAALMPKSG